MDHLQSIDEWVKAHRNELLEQLSGLVLSLIHI